MAVIFIVSKRVREETLRKRISIVYINFVFY